MWCIFYINVFRKVLSNIDVQSSGFIMLLFHIYSTYDSCPYPNSYYCIMPACMYISSIIKKDVTVVHISVPGICAL